MLITNGLLCLILSCQLFNMAREAHIDKAPINSALFIAQASLVLAVGIACVGIGCISAAWAQ